MRRISAVFIAVCMVIIAGSLGGVLYLGLKFDAGTAATIALAAFTGLVLFNGVGGRLRDRGQVEDQIADLSRATADLARQVAETAGRVGSVENRVDGAMHRGHATVDPIAVEIGELGVLVRHLADTVAHHAAALQRQGVLDPPAPLPPAPEPIAHILPPSSPPPSSPPPSESEAGGQRRFRGLSREGIVELIGKAADASRIDLYLQPIVTLPQRKVRYYEALSRLRTEDGDVVPAGEFIDVADSVGLLPKLDNLLLFRCVQITRRLQLKNRDVGLFCNVGASTLADPVYFRQFLDFMEANRALNGSLTFEFRQRDVRAFGPIEHEALAALAERGFRFSMDHVTDLRLEPKELASRSFRFLKVPATLLLSPATGAQSDIHPSDLADLLARAGVDLIIERIENESTVVDLLDYDVRFGQGFLFSPPRPVRADALQGGSDAGELAPTGTG
ncbi:MAG TPA: EAL domain-containing protein [Pseudolabrys sp.]|nr:EAL domain-containing protein [Pseudolabrys sp.]